MIAQLLILGSTVVVALALVLAVAASAAVAVVKGWALLRRHPGQLACLAAPALLGPGLGWAAGHAVAGGAAGIAAGVLLLAAVRFPRRELGSFVEGLVFCTALFGLVGAVMGAPLGYGWAGVLCGFVAAQGFSLLALVESTDRPQP